MALVDLRGRESEPDVRALLEPDAAWNLVGWSRDGTLVACAGVERVAADEVAVRALAARDDADATSLLDAIAEVATASRIVADAEEPAAAAYRAAGFTAQPGHARLVRALDERPAPLEHTRVTSLDEIQAAIRDAWSRETSDDPNEWSHANRARGQCAGTALVIRELLGGDILVANVLRDGVRVDRRAWNRLPSGVTIDLTREQFVRGERFGEPRIEEPVLTQRHPERLVTLRKHVRSRLDLLGRFGLAAPVEPLLEVAAQLLAGRAKRVARTPRLEAQDAHLFVARPVAARVALRLRQ
jgi:hypothetical protein